MAGGARGQKNKHISVLNCDNPQDVNDISKQNVLNIMREIEEKSPLIKKSIEQKQVMIIGAMHDLPTGRVTFFDK